MLHPAFADHHVHLGLVDVSALPASGIGRVGDLATKARDSLLGLSRIAVFLNLIVLVLSALALVVFFWILPD